MFVISLILFSGCSQKKEYTPFRIVETGVSIKSQLSLLSRHEMSFLDSMIILSSAEKMIESIFIDTLNQGCISTAILTVENLGFKDGAKFNEIIKKAHEWGFELCSAEVGPQLRVQYRKQPEGENLFIAMNPLSVYGEQRIFAVQKSSYLFFLKGTICNQETHFNQSDKFVFVMNTE